MFNHFDECIRIIDELLQQPVFNEFRDQIDTTDMPEYLEKIKSPQDLTSIRMRLLNNGYQTIEQWHNDMMLCFSNCILFNERDTTYGDIAAYAMQVYQKKVRHLIRPTPLEYSSRINRYTKKLHDLLRKAPSSVSKSITSILKSKKYDPPSFDFDELSAALSRLTSDADVFNISQIINSYNIKLDTSSESTLVSLSNLPKECVQLLQKYAIEKGAYELD